VRRFALIAALLAATPALAGPDDPWTIDHGRSRIEFSASQIGNFITGRIGAWTGTIVLDPANLSAARIAIRMDMKSAGTGTKDVDDLMRGRNFLDVQRHGDARFVSEAVTSSGGDSYLARGKLTIRDVTRDVALPFSLRIQGDRATARGKLAIKRLDYGVGRDEWAATTHVADEVTIEFAVTATR
jgi:polyisoprenoid-binding protein YceI